MGLFNDAGERCFFMIGVRKKRDCRRFAVGLLAEPRHRGTSPHKNRPQAQEERMEAGGSDVFQSRLPLEKAGSLTQQPHANKGEEVQPAKAIEQQEVARTQLGTTANAHRHAGDVKENPESR
jgi:hypothetical protein